MKDPHFKFQPFEDNIVIKRIVIESVTSKKASKSNIVIPEAQAVKNLMEHEKRKTEEFAQYSQAEEKLLSQWDEHMNQGVVVAVGPGRSLEEGIKIPIAAKVGDRVYIRGMVGEPIIYNKEVYWIIKAHDLFGKVLV